MLANVTVIQPSKTLASLCVPTFLLHRMENEANGAKRDHVIAKINEAKLSTCSFKKVGKGQNKRIYGALMASQTGTVCLWYICVPLVLKRLRYLR